VASLISLSQSGYGHVTIVSSCSRAGNRQAFLSVSGGYMRDGLSQLTAHQIEFSRID
jgi:hypothetical protein